MFTVELPGEKKLSTPCRLDVGEHAFGVHAFVCRQPDENHERVYRWLLERNLRMFGVSFAVDAAGDIYLDGRLPLVAVTPDEVDRLLGSVLTYADESFNTILELGLRLLHPQGVGVAHAAAASPPATSRRSAAGSRRTSGPEVGRRDAEPVDQRPLAERRDHQRPGPVRSADPVPVHERRAQRRAEAPGQVRRPLGEVDAVADQRPRWLLQSRDVDAQVREPVPPSGPVTPSPPRWCSSRASSIASCTATPRRPARWS